MTETTPGVDDATAWRDDRGLARSTAARSLSLLIGIPLLAVLCAAGLAVGSKDLSLQTVWDAVFAFADTDDQVIVMQMRMPRTVLAIVVGVALGVSGAIMQAMTRNPLADPGILGVNAGAAFAVAVAFALLGISGVRTATWFAMAGAAVATVAVYVIGRAGRQGAGVVGMTLAGVAVGAVLSGVTSGLVLMDPTAFDQMRDWNAGALAGRGFDVVIATAPFVAIGTVLAVALARPLNALALGDDLARSLGVPVTTVRVLSVLVVTLLCGAATAAAGPIGFVGLMVPHIARWVVGADQRWILACTIVWSPCLVLLADIIGRILIRPGEMPVGIVTVLIGAPVVVYLVRQLRAVNP